MASIPLGVAGLLVAVAGIVCLGIGLMYAQQVKRRAEGFDKRWVPVHCVADVPNGGARRVIYARRAANGSIYTESGDRVYDHVSIRVKHGRQTVPTTHLRRELLSVCGVWFQGASSARADLGYQATSAEVEVEALRNRVAILENELSLAVNDPKRFIEAGLETVELAAKANQPNALAQAMQNRAGAGMKRR